MYSCPQELDQYHLTDRVLGSGFFSVVHLGIDVASRRQVAIKRIRKKKAASRAALFKECEVNARLSHKNVNKILDLKEDDSSLSVPLAT